MTERRKLTRDLFIHRGMEQNELERRRFGIPRCLQIDPEQAWEELYGKRKFVYLELDRSMVQFGGSGMIVDDESGNGPYPGAH